MHLFKKFSTFYILALFYLLLGILLRIVLIIHPITQTSFTFIEVLKIFSLGFLSDLFVFLISSFFLWLYMLFLSNSKYKSPYGYIIFIGLLSVTLYVTFCNTILNEYGGVLPEIGVAFFSVKTLLFGLLLFFPKYRQKIRLLLYSFILFIYVFCIAQIFISEFLFWNEFGVRFNFIAVDYLIYTNEVIGNILQSYPVVPIYSLLILIVGIITYFIVKKSKSYLTNLPSISQKLQMSCLYLFLFGCSLIVLPFLSSKGNGQNIFANELQANGLFKFYTAFRNSELDYDKFYKQLNQEKAFAILKNQIPNIANQSTLRPIKSDSSEIRKNVVLITIESFSAEFLKTYGNQQNITPFIDSLATKSLFFSNFYAVGNRTVRGLEAVTLCIPPTPGESVVKRVDNKNKFSTGSIFAKKGYTVKYIYGGDAYFDNMKDFFSGNGYGIVDKNSFAANEISFSNIWGVCDEDLYKKAIQTMNKEAKQNKPFFNHIMTVSNHRPFTYPEGKIDIPSQSKSREGGVKYTDYAMREFFKMAQKQSWYKNTVFVILSDHCASSSGKTELPLDKYRIPAMVFSPGFIAPKKCTTLMSQIDIMPTLFGLLHFNYQSKFYGQDVFQSDYKPRALFATYQDLGLLKNNILTIISPSQKVKQFACKLVPNPTLSPENQLFYNEVLLKNKQNDLINETISYYQTASNLLKNKKYQK